MSQGMRVWVLPDPGSSVSIEDMQLLAVGIVYYAAPTPSPGGGGGGGGYVPSPWVYEYEARQALIKKEAREIEKIIIILSGILN